jgi:TPR repeat protein
MYSNGRGVPQNLTTAHKWFNIAAVNSNSLGRKARESIEKKMTPDAIIEAQRRADICMSSDYQDCD